MVLGEDPGLLAPPGLVDSAGLWFSVGWFLAAILWAVWRAATGDRSWYGGGVEACLLVIALAHFASAAWAASYKHPAWLIAWENVVVLVMFGLLRQFAADPEERRGLLAAVLATGLALSGQAIYQAAVEMPNYRARYEKDPEALRQDAASQGQIYSDDDPALERFRKRVFDSHVFATYAHPNSFAGYLALLLPIAVGGAWAARQWQPRSWRTLLAIAAALVLATALYLTHSRGAWLGVGLAGVGVALLYCRPLLWTYRRPLAIAIVLLAAASTALYLSDSLDRGLGKEPGTVKLRLDYWTATWHMLRDHPWLGVGPGNFGRHYPAYMVPTATEYIKDPHNFLLETWASAGLVGLLALLTALGLFFVGIGRRVATCTEAAPAPQSTMPDGPAWSFYVGGMTGLLLAFVLRGALLYVQFLPDEALKAGGRALIWFPSFALLYGIGWSGRTQALALGTGVAALLLELCVSGGISFPAVSQPLWTVAALALGVGSAPPPPRRYSLASLAPLVVLPPVAVAFILLVFMPVMTRERAIREMRVARLQYDLVTRNDRPNHRLAEGYRKEVLEQLQKALAADPGNTAPLVETATWCAWYGERIRSEKSGEEGAKALARARELDPLGKEVLLTLLNLRLHLAGKYEERRTDNLRAAAALVEELKQLDPNEAARAHLLLAAVYDHLKDTPSCRREAERALQLDRDVGPAGKLAPSQRRQLEQWLAPPQEAKPEKEKRP